MKKVSGIVIWPWHRSGIRLRSWRRFSWWVNLSGNAYEGISLTILGYLFYTKDQRIVEETNRDRCPDCGRLVEYVDDKWRHVDPEAECFLYPQWEI